MKQVVLCSALIILINCIAFSSVSSANDIEYKGEITFMYNHDVSTCGKDGADQGSIDRFSIKGLPRFEDYPAEESSAKTLDAAQMKALEADKWNSFNLGSGSQYGANFNGHYFVAVGQAAQCTGCAFSEIIDLVSEKKFGKMEMYQGYLFTKFRKDSSLIIENFPPADVDACIFNEFPAIVFYQVKNGELIKIKELKLSKTEEFQRIKNGER